jgi:hypothetical protein
LTRARLATKHAGDRTGKKRGTSSNELRRRLPKSKLPLEDIADMITEGVASNSLAVRDWTEGVLPPEQLGISELYTALEDLGRAVAKGDLRRPESLLTAQAVSLNTIYVTLARRSHGAKYMENFERYLRLALRAQAQCRATIETLALMKNPPVFARQANIARGPQQVNNGPVLNGSRARGNSETEPNKLLPEAHGERVERSTATTAGTSNSAMETVGARNRAKKPWGQGEISSECLPRRRPPRDTSHRERAKPVIP